MSLIFDIGPNDEKLPDLIEKYERELEKANEHIKIKGKTLLRANDEQASLQFFYDARHAELHALIGWYELEIERIRGECFREITNNNQRNLSDRAKNQFIDRDSRYTGKFRILLEVKEIYDRYGAVVDAFKSRAYVLNNITKIKIASLDNEII